MTYEMSKEASVLKIYLESKGELTLPQIANLIISGDQDCVDNLLQTIRDTIAATQIKLHVQAVKKLASKCDILKELLADQNFYHKDEMTVALAKLAQYAGDINAKLH